MIAPLRRLLLPIALIFALCLATTDTARASVAYASDGKAAGVIIAVVAVGVLVGVGIYFALHHGHSVRGCAAARGGGGGLQIRNEGDDRAYLLTGDAGAVPAGHRVRLSGNKVSDPAGGRSFAVHHVSRDYGACQAQP